MRLTLSLCCISLLLLPQLALCLETENSQLPKLRLPGNKSHHLPPYIWFDTCTLRPEGSIPRLSSRLAADLDHELVYINDTKSLPFKQLLIKRRQQLLTGEIDLALVIGEKLLNDPLLIKTSLPATTNNMTVALANSVPAISKIDQLKKYRGVSDLAFSAERYELLLSQGYTLSRLANAEELIISLAAGKADFAFIDSSVANQLIRVKKLNNKVRVGHINIALMPAYWVMAANGPKVELMPAIERLSKIYLEQGLVPHWRTLGMKMWLSRKRCDEDTAKMPISAHTK